MTSLVHGDSKLTNSELMDGNMCLLLCFQLEKSIPHAQPSIQENITKSINDL